MVDQESQTYRPRRAFIEPDAEHVEPERAAPPGRIGYGNGSGPAGAAQHGRNGNGNGSGPARPPVMDEDRPKPLYRDDVRANGWTRPTSRAAALPPADPPTEETALTPATLAPRRPAPVDDEITTILPRSRPTKHRTQALDAIDDYDDDERPPLGRRVKLALVIGAVAAAVIIGLVVGYAVLAGDKSQTQPSLSPSTSGRGPSSGTSQSGQSGTAQSGTALLGDGSMLSPGQAKAFDHNRSWKVESTQHGAKQDGPTAACFGGEPLEGTPTPQQEIVRQLKSTGKNAPSAIHDATAYPSAEEASQAYAIASKTLGGCAVAGFYIESGHLVNGVGDQAAGVVVMEVQGKKARAHSVVLNRTGRVVNVVDAFKPSKVVDVKAVDIKAVAKALGQVNGSQCSAAGGNCSGNVSVKKGPPPLGGDEPGFFATGDLPPAGPTVYPWVATSVELPKEDFQGSQCEGVVNWATESAKSRSSRVYLIQESGTNFFGLNEIVLTMKDGKTAAKEVNKIKSSLSGCKSRKLTASVTKPNKVRSIGAENIKVQGWTTVVSQKSTQGTAKYRVGIVSAGPKVIYSFLNPRGNYDFNNHQWNTVAVRGGERSTQVN
jgi:hypothetical protein